MGDARHKNVGEAGWKYLNSTRIKLGYVSVSVINIGDGRQIPNVILIALFKILLITI